MNRFNQVEFRKYSIYIVVAALFIIFGALSLILNGLLANRISDANNTSSTQYFLARVEQIQSVDENYSNSANSLQVWVWTEPLQGEQAQVVVSSENSESTPKKHDWIVVQSNLSGLTYTGLFKLPGVFLIAAFFVMLVVYFARKKGLLGLIGLGFSLLVVFGLVVPLIGLGFSPTLVGLVGVYLAAFVTIYLAHGFNERTTLAVFSTLIALTVAIVLAQISVYLVGLDGAATEETVNLRFGVLANLDLRGLLLSGIIFGVLGVLDDITTAQTSVVAELKLANTSFNQKDLFSRSIVVGREHISALVNTLFFAYLGGSFPIFLGVVFFAGQPLWVVLNSSWLIEEIVRTLVGSSALVLAVPISSFLASKYFASRIPAEYNGHQHHNH